VHRTFGMLALALALSATPSAAQIAWDAPPLISHVAPAGVSVFLVSPAGGDLGGLLTYRHSAGPVGLGYRFAIADESGPRDDDVAVAAGIDVSGFLARAVEGSELDVIWWSGAGFGIGDEVLVSIPLGALVGWSGSGGDAVLSPYAGGHLSLDISSADQDNVNLSGAVDLGLDIVLSSVIVRFGASVGDREAIAIGVKFGA
jgi:hypothetical protein